MGLPDPARTALAAYLDTLAAWSPRVNLTAARTPGERVRLLVAAVLPALPLVRTGRLVDVGSGNGSPGLVLALTREDVHATLLEPRAKRWAFLREAVRAAGAESRVDAVRARHDGYDGPPADTLTLRALALPLRSLAPLVVPGGRLLVFGAVPAPDAAFGAEPAIASLPGLHVFRRSA
ncbi:MAG TPA: RsmG family class I SAM-dependent methyltransferase [Vicinamibacteria bacterium]